ncbi:hypothetical protein ACS0TY_009625 [Phlomoides rotata]
MQIRRDVALNHAIFLQKPRFSAVLLPRVRVTVYQNTLFHLELCIRCISSFRKYMLQTLQPFFMNSTSGGMFLNSCFTHCQSESQDTWLASDSFCISPPSHLSLMRNRSLDSHNMTINLMFRLGPANIQDSCSCSSSG